jgi:hypothetical protein
MKGNIGLFLSHFLVPEIFGSFCAELLQLMFSRAKVLQGDQNKTEPIFRWGNLKKIESKQMRDICFLEFGNTVQASFRFLQCYQT